jgi:sortase A
MLTGNGAIGRRSRWIGGTLIIFGLVCLLTYAAVSIHSAWYQRRAKAELTREITTESPTMVRETRARSARPAPLAGGAVIGRVDVPRLKLSAAIAEGDDDATLRKAVGHLSDTSLPWEETGNAAFAAHRDGLFRPLRDIRLNDEVNVVTPRGEFHYVVRKTEVVEPDDVWVLAPTDSPTITLITCYPFSFIGHAPKRFVVHAARVIPEVSGVPLRGTVVN